MRALLILAIVAGCGHAPGPRLDCPAGTSPADTGAARGCKRPDGTWHGPFVSRYPDGKPNQIGAFKDGVQDGAWQVLAPDGRVLGSYEIVDGAGVVVDWHEGGAKKSELHYRDGKQEGAFTTWHPNGEKASEGSFHDVVLDGPVTMWSDAGRMTMKVHHTEGRMHGLSQSWDPATGELVREEEYVHGQRVREAVHAGGKLVSEQRWPIEEPGTSIATRGHPRIDAAWQTCTRHDECSLVATTCCACDAGEYVAVHFRREEDARKALAVSCEDATCPAQMCQRVDGRCDGGRCVSAQ